MEAMASILPFKKDAKITDLPISKKINNISDSINFGTVPIYLVSPSAFTLVPPSFTPFDLDLWMAHFFSTSKISLF